jgi:hypothetical protein
MIPRPRGTSRSVLALVLLALISPTPARAQGTAADASQYFKVEVSPEPVPRGGWAVEGYVYSTHPYRVNSVRVRVDVLDSDGKVIHQAYGWVPGDIPAGGRAYFFVSLPTRGAAYRAEVLSFYLVAREAQ